MRCGRSHVTFRGLQVKRLLRRWVVEEDGQDLIEYALLCCFIGFAGAAVLTAFGDAMNTTYTAWDNAVQSDALVKVPEPKAP